MMVPFWSVGRRTSRGFARVSCDWGRGGDVCATDSVETITYQFVITYIFACFEMDFTTRLEQLLGPPR
jgi:hypothetical protein